MAMAYKSAGAGAATNSLGSPLVVQAPATVDANDILILHAWHDITIIDLSPTSGGWTLIAGPFSPGNGRQWAWGKVAVGNEDSANYTMQTSQNTAVRMGRIYSFSGYESGAITGLITDVGSDSGSGTGLSDNDVTTPRDGCIAVNLYASNTAETWSVTNTGVSGGTWVENVGEFTSTLGGDGSIAIQTCALATAGTIGSGTRSRAFSNGWCFIGFSIQPSGPSMIYRPRPRLTRS
jgi:hypothetical protein